MNKLQISSDSLSDENKNHKSKCKYCDGKTKCITCNDSIECSQITNCEGCGGYYGRPLKGPIAGGCLIIEYFGNIPYIHLIMEVDMKNNLKGTFNDPGGKYDADKDKNIEETCIREIREEMGFMLLSLGDKYVQIGKSNPYRCYISVNKNEKTYILTGIPPEAAPIKMKVSQFINLYHTDKSLFSPRIKKLLFMNVMSKNEKHRKKNITLLNYLKTLL